MRVDHVRRSIAQRGDDPLRIDTEPAGHVGERNWLRGAGGHVVYPITFGDLHQIGLVGIGAAGVDVDLDAPFGDGAAQLIDVDVETAGIARARLQ